MTSKSTVSSPTRPLPSSSLAWPPTLPATTKPPPPPRQVAIPVEDEWGGSVQGYLHLPTSSNTTTTASTTAAILLSGAGGGTSGPSSIYLTLAARLSSLGLPVLRLDYRHPARTRPCVADTLAAMDHLSQASSATRFVLVGWSFGGAPVYTVGGRDRRVTGCATVASQTADATEGIARCSPTPVLLLHGTGDRVLSDACSRRLWEAYGERKGGSRQLRLFEGADHALTGQAEAAERCIAEFVLERAGVLGEVLGRAQGREVLGTSLMGKREMVEGMRDGGDLRGSERVE